MSCKAMVMVIPKPGKDPKLVGNLWPISILIVTSKSREVARIDSEAIRLWGRTFISPSINEAFRVYRRRWVFSATCV